MNNKMILGFLITLIGLVFSAGSFFYAVANPMTYNLIGGPLGSLLGRGVMVPFISGTAVMIAGLVICFKEVYGKK